VRSIDPNTLSMTAMPNKRHATTVAVAIALVAFLTARVIWPDVPGSEQPPASLLPFFIILGAISSVAFGLGATILLLGRPAFDRLSALTPGMRTVTWLSSAWLLVSWWPHENMHRVHVDGDYMGLVLIEYVFHVTLIIAGVIVALAFLRLAHSAPNAPLQKP
jgi:hypothetical protein